MDNRGARRVLTEDYNGYLQMSRNVISEAISCFIQLNLSLMIDAVISQCQLCIKHCIAQYCYLSSLIYTV